MTKEFTERIAMSDRVQATNNMVWPPKLGPNTPKICMGRHAETDAEAMRQLKQVGVDHVLMGGGRIPWDESELRARMARFEANGLTICNMMISGFPDVIYGRSGRDEQIEKVIQSIRVAGKVDTKKKLVVQVWVILPMTMRFLKTYHPKKRLENTREPSN
jgi:hypothetical protein